MPFAVAEFQKLSVCTLGEMLGEGSSLQRVFKRDRAHGTSKIDDPLEVK